MTNVAQDAESIREQDWEFAEEISPDEWETVDIQIETEREAIAAAQIHANETGHRCSVTTSIRIVDPVTNSVEDRDIVPGAEAIIVNPQAVSA